MLVAKPHVQMFGVGVAPQKVQSYAGHWKRAVAPLIQPVFKPIFPPPSCNTVQFMIGFRRRIFAICIPFMFEL